MPPPSQDEMIDLSQAGFVLTPNRHQSLLDHFNHPFLGANIMGVHPPKFGGIPEPLKSVFSDLETISIESGVVDLVGQDQPGVKFMNFHIFS